MNTEIFFEWLNSFDQYISGTKNLSVVLLLDRASCHGSEENFPSLKNVLVLFLRANTTSFLQPMDAGIIACIKRRYRNNQVLSALNSDDPVYESTV